MPEPRVAIAYDCLYPVQHGGGERVYRRMAELFVDRGSSVTYVTRADWPADASPSAPFDLVSVWRGAIYDSTGTRTTSSAVAFASGLYRHFARHRRQYDVVIVAALPVLNVFAVWLALLGSRSTLVVDWLEVWPARKWRSYAGILTGTIAWLLQRMAVGMGDILTVNSSFTGARLRRYRRQATPIVLGLVDLVGPDPDASTSPPVPPVALFVGRHIADKRLDALPAALRFARDRLPELRLRVVGSGPETAVLRAAAEAAGVSDAVDLLGRVEDETLRELFRSASVLVNPSEREGFGLVVAEAASAGTPSVVVAGPDNAAAELVRDGVNGEVAAAVDGPVLGAALARVIEAGRPLRETTLGWFRTERIEHGLARSVDEIRARVSSAA